MFYYYYKLDNEEEVRAEEASYTFDGLTKNSNHTISVRVEDAAGNISSTLTDSATVGLTAKEVILANEGGAAAIEGKGIPDFSTVATTDEGMYAAEDDWGTSYYYRGAVNDNWIKFGTNSSGKPLYWRIIRINGDGTIRLIYNGTNTTTTGTSTQIQSSAFNNTFVNNAYVGYMYELNNVHGLQESSTIKGILDIWYSQNLADETDSIHIAGSAGFCGDRQPSTSNESEGTGTTATYYGAYIRLYSSNSSSNASPSLECPYEDSNGIKQDLYTTSESEHGNQALTNPIGLITADEVAMAGGVVASVNQSYYLYTGQAYWTLSPYEYDYPYADVFFVGDYGGLGSISVNNPGGVRPVINIRSDVQITGTGSASDPYKVVGAD